MNDMVLTETSEKQYLKKVASRILTPDHPLLIKFQQVLKEHLLIKISREEQEVRDIEAAVSKKYAELERNGLRNYQHQQHVSKQQEFLKNLMENVETVKEKLEKKEEDLDNNKKILKDIANKLFESDRVKRELAREIEALKDLNSSLVQSEDTLENHIQINKRIAAKHRVDTEKMTKEKKIQDFLLQSLIDEIWKIESETETIQLEMKVKQDYINNMEDKIAVANTNISAIQTEYNHLMLSWKGVVVAIGHREDVVDCLNEKLSQLTSHHTKLLAETHSIKKEVKKVLLNNETLTHLRNVILRDNDIHLNGLRRETTKKETLENEMINLQKIITETEKSILHVQEECKLNYLALNKNIKEFDKLAERKIILENEITAAALDKIHFNKANQKLNHDLGAIATKRRSKEVTLRQVLNRKSLVLADIEQYKLQNEEQTYRRNDIIQQNKKLTEEVEQLKNQIETEEFVYRNKKMKYAVIKDKLVAQEQITPSAQHESKEDIRMRELEQLIRDIQGKLKNLQNRWLTEQNTMMGIAKQRQDQINLINVKKKQALLSQQKNLRINEELAAIKKQEERVNLNVQALLTKSQKFCEVLFEKRGHKQHLHQDNIFLQGEYDAKLKNAELKLLETESDIASIEEKKLILSKDLIVLTRECLAWEQNFLLAKQTLVHSKQEQQKGGEVNAVRQDISRRKAELEQLTNLQNRLLRDLELSISRRDSIYFKSEAIKALAARTKHSEHDISKKRFARKIVDVKNKIKLLKNDIKSMKEKIKFVEEKRTNLTKQIENMKHNNVRASEQKITFITTLEESKSNRHSTFELLVFYQKKTELYKNIVLHRKPYTKFKKEDELFSAYEKENGTRRKLSNLVNILDKFFPDRKYELYRIFNSLSVIFTNKE